MQTFVTLPVGTKSQFFQTTKGMFIYYRRGGDGSKMGGLRKTDEVRGGVYENDLTSIGGSTKKM